MTDNNKNNNTRLRLTLKTGTPNTPITNKNIANKSSVQVTIKGRKKESTHTAQNSDQEITARFIAVAKSEQDSFLTETQFKTHEILKQNLKTQTAKTEPEQTIIEPQQNIQPETISIKPAEVWQENHNTKPEKPQENPSIKQEIVQPTISSTPPTIKEAEEKNNTTPQNQKNSINNFYQNNLDDFQIDAFDVRNKIKQSLQQSNK